MPLGDSLASILPEIHHVRGIFWASGQRPGCPTCIPLLWVQDLMLAFMATHGLEGFAPLCR